MNAGHPVRVQRAEDILVKYLQLPHNLGPNHWSFWLCVVECDYNYITGWIRMSADPVCVSAMVLDSCITFDFVLHSIFY